MDIRLSEELVIEVAAIAAIAGCSAGDVVTAILRRGYGAIEDEARHLRAIEQWDAGRKTLAAHEPTQRHWRCALGLEDSPCQ